MPRTLYFHIGNHKTGSTSIQSALARCENPAIFNQINPKAKNDRYSSWFDNSWVTRGRNFKGDDWVNKAGIASDLARALIAHNPEGDVVFSAEDMSWIFDGKIISTFAQDLRPHFDEVKIIAYLRRQDRNAVSLHQQASKSTKSRMARFLGAEPRALPRFQDHFALYFDYNYRLGLWADAFGDDAMIFRIFGDVIDAEHIVENFCDIIGIELPRIDAHLRQSIPKSWQLINQKIQQLELDINIPDELFELYSEGDKMMPPRAEAQEFYEKFRASNIAMQKRFQINEREAIFDEDYSEFPTQGNEDWDRKSSEQMVELLLLTLARSQGLSQAHLEKRNFYKRRLNRLKVRYNTLAKEIEQG